MKCLQGKKHRFNEYKSIFQLRVIDSKEKIEKCSTNDFNDFSLGVHEMWP